MNIGILGSGQVGQTLGSGFIKHGHSVMIGTRNTEKLKDWQSEQPAAQVGSFEATCAFADLIVLAVKGSVAESVIKSLSSQLAGKVVIDATNPIADSAPDNGALRFFTEQNRSLMEILQETAPDARFSKGIQFNRQPTHGQPFISGNTHNVYLRK